MDCVVFIVHSGEVHHIQTLHVLVKVVQEWDRGAAGLSSTNWDLEGGKNKSLACTHSVKDSAWPNAQRGNASRDEVPARRLMD